jgi:hypothetical protein
MRYRSVHDRDRDKKEERGKAHGRSNEPIKFASSPFSTPSQVILSFVFPSTILAKLRLSLLHSVLRFMHDKPSEDRAALCFPSLSKYSLPHALRKTGLSPGAWSPHQITNTNI